MKTRTELEAELERCLGEIADSLGVEDAMLTGWIVTAALTHGPDSQVSILSLAASGQALHTNVGLLDYALTRNRSKMHGDTRTGEL